MRTRMYGGVRGRKTKVGGKPTFVFLLLDSQLRLLRLPINRSESGMVQRYYSFGKLHMPMHCCLLPPLKSAST